MLLLVDNRDSFTYNLAQFFWELGVPLEVRRAAQLTYSELLDRNPQAIVTGPGPGHPLDAVLSLQISKAWQGPLLGVCLGHQALACATGGRVRRCQIPWHGRASAVQHDGTGLFHGLPGALTIGRYHSLTVEEESLPGDWTVTARSADGEIQAMAHKTRPHFGVQFHPESILSEGGHTLLGNFWRLANSSPHPAPHPAP